MRNYMVDGGGVCFVCGVGKEKSGGAPHGMWPPPDKGVYEGPPLSALANAGQKGREKSFS